MGDRRRVHLNIASNALNTGLNAVAGLITLPLLISRLGAESYGLWVLVSASAGLFILADFGMSAAVGRRVAGYLSAAEQGAIDKVISTSLSVLAGLSLLVVSLMLLLVQIFPLVFPIPAAKISDVQTALLISGIASAVYFPAAAFDGILWGHERFDLHNAVEIPALVLRLIGILVLVNVGTSLTELALIVALPAVAAYAVRIAIAVHIQPGLRISPRYFDSALMVELVHFGGWFGVVTLARATLPNAATFVIGASLGPAAVTVFTIPRLLVSYANWIIAAVTQVIGPRAAVLHLSSDRQGQRQLFVMSSRYAIALAVFICAGLLQFGAPFLQLWLPQHSGIEYRILVILALAEVLPLSQWVSYNVVVSMAQHRALAGIALSELALVFAGTALGALWGGLIGVTLICAALAFTFRGIWTAVVAAKLIGLDPRAYLLRTLGGTAALAAAPAVLVAILPLAWTPMGWLQFIAAVSAYCTLYACAALVALKFVQPSPDGKRLSHVYVGAQHRERRET